MQSRRLALETGGSLQGVLAGLAARSPGIPSNVEDSLRDWAARRERLTLQPCVDLIEYPSSAERDAGVAAMKGARPLGERFALLPAKAAAPAGASVRDYREPAPAVLKFYGGGRVKVNGRLDLVARGAIGKLARGFAEDKFELDPEAVRAGALTPGVRRSLEERSKGGFPPQLDALLRAWSGASPPPAVAAASLFRHPDAALLAEFKQVGNLLDVKLSPSTYLVQAGKQAELRAALEKLGLSVGAELTPESLALAAAGEGELQRGLSTRKMREMLEAAVEAGHDVELEYAEEREQWTRYGSYRRSRGKVRKELVTPESVTYQGSTPYLICYTVARGADRVVRVGYIDALAVLVGS